MHYQGGHTEGFGGMRDESTNLAMIRDDRTFNGRMQLDKNIWLEWDVLFLTTWIRDRFKIDSGMQDERSKSHVTNVMLRMETL